ncbi:hypothetical protein PG997_006075 [Apiospora hydei]|uniref:Glutamine amidotransferase domain-containing protein n=1 Tax=Apiospora hydei TaxID=1337664 RepID=A0ABR1WMN8_9PEZI
MPTVYLLDYVAGNIRSLANAIEKCGYTLILPGVGHFGHCMSQLASAGYLPAINAHIASGKPFMAICVGIQALFEGSVEDPGVSGLGLIKGNLERFDDKDKSVPHIGWNSANSGSKSLHDLQPGSKYYYVHSYMYPYKAGELEAQGWTVATGTYGNETFVGAVAKDNILATQFHPEKSGVAGLRVIKSFLTGEGVKSLGQQLSGPAPTGGLTRRVIACLDVRTNDLGDLVVTKGDQYDVREKGDDRGVRNLGKPVEMAKKYYEQGADEVTFLNITSFRDCPIADLPMLEILRRTAETVFVSALEIATMYFKSGADKVSIGSDAVLAAEEYYSLGRKLFGNTAIEQISRAYGNQAVVVSIDPKRVFVPKQDATRHATIRTAFPAPRGGRETRDMDVVELVQAVEAMGAGEILLNCIDRDGTNSGFDLELINQVKSSIRIPVIASSGAGNPAISRRGEYTVQQVKDYLAEKGLEVRQFEGEL